MAGPFNAPKPTVLAGQWGSLRPLNPATDANELYRLTHAERRDETWAEMKVGPFPTEAEFKLHLDELVSDPARSFYAIADPADRPLGWLCLMEVQPIHRTVEVGYVTFGLPLQRTTLATETFYLIMSYVFDELGFQRLEWTCTATNLRSRKAAERLGFKLEGVMRNKLTLKGRTIDVPMYSMLANEWPLIRAAIERWLSPSNFQAGEQIAALCTAMIA